MKKAKSGRLCLRSTDPKMRAIVEGLNIMSVHTKPNAANADGGIVKEGRIYPYIQPTSHIDPKDGKAMSELDERADDSRKEGEIFKKIRGGNQMSDYTPRLKTTDHRRKDMLQLLKERVSVQFERCRCQDLTKIVLSQGLGDATADKKGH